MIKRISIVCLLVIFASIGIAFADAPAATKARSATVSNGVEAVNGIGDVSSGNTPEVTDAGALSVTNRARAVTSQFGDALVYTGAATIQLIALEGELAGDYAAIYDGLTTAGTAKFDPRIDTNTDSISIDAKGAYFSTGIYVDALNNGIRTTVVYDY